MTLKLIVCAALSAAALFAQAPTIAGVVNAGSQIPAGFPNSGIAQGALFDIYGTNLSAAPPTGSPYTVGTLPLPTTAGLAGAVVTITVSGTTVTAPILFALPTQIGAVMPSNAPLGTGTLTVAYNGKSVNTPVTVVQSAFGISFVYLQYADNSVGMGEQAAATFVNNPTQAAITTHTAAPGDQMIIWGTGLGATTVAGDNSGAPFGNVGATPQVFVGGIASPTVSYAGRSPGSVALDQINFTIPQNAPIGCNVSVYVQTTSGTTPVVSNGPTISIGATDGATCSDTTAPFPLSILSAKQSSVNILDVGVQEQTQVTAGTNGQTTSTVKTNASIFGLNFTQAQVAMISATFLQSSNYQPTFGSCYFGFNATQGNGPFPDSTPLNLGATVTLTPPSGTPIVMTSEGPGVYGTSTTTNPPSGSWNVSSGTGITGVAPFNFTFPMPQEIVWTNQSTISASTITRSNPLTITWTGGDSNGYVDIQGDVQVGSYGAGFECAAPTSAGTFTIPSSAMLGLTTGQGSISVGTYAIPSSIGTVPGFYLSGNSSGFQTNVGVTFK